MAIKKKLEKTPSEIRFQLARAFARRLQKVLKDDLLAVYIGGSAAYGMAMSFSDADVIVICKNIPTYYSKNRVFRTLEPMERKFKITIQPHTIFPEDIPDLRRRYRYPVEAPFWVRIVKNGVRLAFAQKSFLQKYGKEFPKPPNRLKETLLSGYARPLQYESPEKRLTEFEERLKNRKKSFKARKPRPLIR